MILPENKNVIISPINKLFKLAKSLCTSGDKSEGLFAAEGSKVVKSLLSQYKPAYLLTSESFANELYDLSGPDLPEINILSDKLWREVSSTESPVKLIALFDRPVSELSQIVKGDLLVLEGIQDPGNLGSLLRSAAASGWRQVLCLKGCTDPYGPKVVRAAAGFFGELTIVSSTTVQAGLAHLQAEGYELVLSSSHAENSIANFKRTSAAGPLALVLGNEGQGLSKAWDDCSGATTLKIPLAPDSLVESLNVGVAGALLMFKLKGLV